MVTIDVGGSRRLDAIQRDRAAGVLLATAAGDALGAPYEFGPPLQVTTPVAMDGGGGWHAGEWTDDTAMAVAIAEIAAEGRDLRDRGATDDLVRRWVGWSRTAKDVGIQTREVLGRVDDTDPTGSVLAAAAELHRRTGRSGGNGTLMRTAPVALAYLDDPIALTEAATRLSALTHYDPEAGEACVLWCLAIRRAVLTGELDLRAGLGALSDEGAARWRDRIEHAETASPADFERNGWVVEALQGAWCAIHTTPVPAEPAEHLELALEAAVRGGRDADTVAAIAGGLLGAVYGASAVPWRWRRVLHGWPGIAGRDLLALADGILRRGTPAPGFGYERYEPVGVLGRHPHDDGLWLGGVAGLDRLPPEVDALVSLCRVDPLPEVAVVVESRLVDRVGENAHLDFVLGDAVDAVRGLREEGHVVYLHCVQAQSRTPTVAALYSMRHFGRDADTALDELRAVMPGARPNADFLAALARARSGTA